jgi:hypothetical protein
VTRSEASLPTLRRAGVLLDRAGVLLDRAGVLLDRDGATALLAGVALLLPVLTRPCGLLLLAERPRVEGDAAAPSAPLELLAGALALPADCLNRALVLLAGAGVRRLRRIDLAPELAMRFGVLVPVGACWGGQACAAMPAESSPKFDARGVAGLRLGAPMNVSREAPASYSSGSVVASASSAAHASRPPSPARMKPRPPAESAGSWNDTARCEPALVSWSWTRWPANSLGDREGHSSSPGERVESAHASPTLTRGFRRRDSADSAV